MFVDVQYVILNVLDVKGLRLMKTTATTQEEALCEVPVTRKASKDLVPSCL